MLLLLTLVEDRVRRTSIHRVGLRAGKARLEPYSVPGNSRVERVLPGQVVEKGLFGASGSGLSTWGLGVWTVLGHWVLGTGYCRYWAPSWSARSVSLRRFGFLSS